MFEHLFENRNSTVTNLIKLGDCLGRSLRENVELFSIDSEETKVAYLTENGKVITGNYAFNSDISLNSIKIQEIDIFSDNNTFDSFVNEKVSSFVGNLNSNSYTDAENSFSDILSLWENRLKFENVKKRLDEKVLVFSEAQNILNTEEFGRFLEGMPQFLDYLTDNKDDISNVKDIENAIKLSNSVSQAFNFPSLTYSNLEEGGKYIIKEGNTKSIYEMLCKRELVAKELIESKKNFEELWATNPHIRNLASLIFENDEDVILESLVSAVIDVPYLALSTKKQLFESLDNALGLSEQDSISTKEVKTYSSKLFEMKKPMKKIITDLLNEKYGINILNLKETPSFKNLANTQVVIFEALSRLAPKGSIVKSTLSEVANLLKTKNGVEVIDVNNIIQEAFEACEYGTFCEEYTLVENFDFSNILDKDVTPKELLEATKTKLLLDKDKKNKDNLGKDEKSKKAAEVEDTLADEGDDEDDSLNPAKGKMDSEEAANEKKSSKKTEEVEPEKGAEPAAASEPLSDDPAMNDPMSDDEFMTALKDMDDLMQGLGSDEEEDSQTARDTKEA